MFFRTRDKTLLGSDGEVIRRFHCPLEGKDLEMIWQSADTLRCRGCHHSVRLAYDLNETQLKKLLQEEPGICLLIPKHAGHMTLMEDDDDSKP